MANQKQLRKLKQSVEDWNSWRKSHPNVKINLRGANLKGLDLSGADFSEADIRSTNFSGAKLIRANFSGAQCGLQKRWIVLFIVCSYLTVLVVEVLVHKLVIEALEGVIILVVSVLSLVGVGLLSGIGLFLEIGLVFVGILGIAVGIELGVRMGLLSVLLGLVTVLILVALVGVVEDFKNPFVIAFAAMAGTSFYNANLTDANFNRARLKNTDFRKSTIIRVYWYGAKMLNLVRCGDTYLKDTQVRLWLIGKGIDKNFDNNKFLRGINLQGINLIDASLIKADLSEANLQNSDLSRAKLYEAQLKGTNLTGACIEDWNINRKTNLEGVICDYIYLREGQNERRPSDPNKNFKPGDFANLVWGYLSTVDLIFSEGIDWQGFLESFEKLQVEDGNGELAIQAIERKTNGAFVVRVEVPPDADKANIEASFWEKYNPLLEAKDREIKLLSQQTEFYSQQVKVIRKDNTKLLGIVETMAEKETIKVQQNFNAPVTGVAGNIEGNQNIFTSQSIAQASTEIQNLLSTLQNNGLTQEQAEQKVAQDLATTAENDPTALGKLVNWGKSLGNKAAETSVSEVARRVIKLALNLAGVPMP